MDWLSRVELHAGESPLGEVPAGEIVVVDKRSGRAHTGVDAVRKLCLQLPLFFPYGLFLHFRFARGLAGEAKPGRAGGTRAT